MAKYKDWLTKDGLHKITQWAREGLNDEQIATEMGIRTSTFYDWKNRFSDFAEAIKNGRKQPIKNIVNAMYQKAIGYTDAIGDYHPPETVAQIFLLKNWDKEHYRDKPLTKLEEEKLRQETERLRLENELKRRTLEGDGELDQLKELIEGIDHAAVEDAEDVLEK